MRYTVVASHRSEFPQPITLSRGDALVVGERYQGPEGWDDWYLCEAAGQQPGWVPAQVIGRDTQQQAFAREDYCARELDVHVGQVLDGGRIMNGWVWSETTDGRGSGWVPLRVLREGA
ncbi:SH3 domain-containing protein [Stenotrophomonas sp.]|uniref:SH3 domain-containing protein n=1 Tax=Stenotrophomonas sp. TaxID=69392 RepID=UPI0028A87937|nr:SH3 domain-containing protein [Stenotrophomonas sp.]